MQLDRTLKRLLLLESPQCLEALSIGRLRAPLRFEPRRLCLSLLLLKCGDETGALGI